MNTENSSRQKRTTGFKGKIGKWFGVFFIALLFIPMGVYHYAGNASISSALFPFQTPFGLILLFAGIFLVAKEKLLPSTEISQILIGEGALMLIVFYLQSTVLGFFLGIWHGVPANFDVDYYGALPVHAGTAIVAILAGLLSKD